MLHPYLANDWNLPIERIEKISTDCYLVHHEGGYLSFAYLICGVKFHFSLLCEVGQRVKFIFEHALTNYPNEVVELDCKPWLIHRKVEPNAPTEPITSTD